MTMIAIHMARVTLFFFSGENHSSGLSNTHFSWHLGLTPSVAWAKGKASVNILLLLILYGTLEISHVLNLSESKVSHGMIWMPRKPRELWDAWMCMCLFRCRHRRTLQQSWTGLMYASSFVSPSSMPLRTPSLISVAKIASGAFNFWWYKTRSEGPGTRKFKENICQALARWRRLSNASLEKGLLQSRNAAKCLCCRDRRAVTDSNFDS